MDLGRRMRCSMSRSDIPSRSLATSREVGYSLAHGDEICVAQPPSASRHGRMHDRRSVGLCDDHKKTGVAEACGRRCAIRVAGAGSQTGDAGGPL